MEFELDTSRSFNAIVYIRVTYLDIVEGKCVNALPGTRCSVPYTVLVYKKGVLKRALRSGVGGLEFHLGRKRLQLV